MANFGEFGEMISGRRRSIPRNLPHPGDFQPMVPAKRLMGGIVVGMVLSMIGPLRIAVPGDISATEAKQPSHRRNKKKSLVVKATMGKIRGNGRTFTLLKSHVN